MGQNFSQKKTSNWLEESSTHNGQPRTQSQDSIGTSEQTQPNLILELPAASLANGEEDIGTPGKRAQGKSSKLPLSRLQEPGDKEPSLQAQGCFV